MARRRGRGSAEGEPAHKGSQGADRLRVPELQPDRRAGRGGECGAAIGLSGRAQEGAQGEGGGGAAPDGHQPPRPPLPPAALGRSAAARGHRPCRRDESQADPRRRAYRQPRLEERTGGDATAHPAEPRGHHRADGDPLRA